MMPFAAMRMRNPVSAPPPAGSTWDPAAKGAAIALSNGNLTAAGSSSGVFNTVYGTLGKSSGKWQYEIVIDGGTAAERPLASMADKTNVANLLGTYTGNSGATVKESLGYWGNGFFYRNLTAGASNNAVTATAINDVVTIALDVAANAAYWYLNGVLKRTETLPAGKTWYPAASCNGGASKVTLRTGSLTYPVSGFTDWG